MDKLLALAGERAMNTLTLESLKFHQMRMTYLIFELFSSLDSDKADEVLKLYESLSALQPENEAQK